MMFFVVK